jgi:ribosomal protein S18 acetylase RimI-like enzyme
MRLSSRQARTSDDAFVSAIYFETQRELIERLFGWRGDAEERARFAKHYDRANTRILRVDGRDAGWWTVRRGPDIALDAIYLAPAFQNRGIGTALLGRLIAEGKASELAVRLSTAKLNRARGLYERLGFTVVHDDEYKVYMKLPPPRGRLKRARSTKP